MSSIQRGDGHTRPIQSDDIQVGHVVRETHSDGSVPAFPDSIIIRADRDTSTGELIGPIYLARPHSFNCERYEATLKGLQQISRLVLTSRDIAHKQAIDLPVSK